MNKYQKEYIFRINRVINYIENNLDKELSLSELADVANFSQFHFHRIFSAFMGETLNDFIKRKRVEKAASLLISDPDKPISEITTYCGYNSFSVFCRNFRERYGTTAKEFRSQWEGNYSKNGKIESRNDQLISFPNDYVCENNSQIKKRMIMKKDVEVKEMSSVNVIYCSHTGRFDQIEQAYQKLCKWAGPRGLMSGPDVKSITYYHDDPKVTEPGKVRQSACLIVKEDVKVEGEIGKMQIPGGKYFVGHFEILPTEFQEAWDSMCLWLSESGYLPDDKHPYELYHNDHEKHPEHKFIVDICIPVKPL